MSSPNAEPLRRQCTVVVGDTNGHRYLIATQDGKLMKRLAGVPGVPIVKVTGHRPVLLKPSNATAKEAQQVTLIISRSCAHYTHALLVV